MKELGKTVLSILIFYACFLSRGEAARLLWGWFIVPRYHVPTPGLFFACWFIWIARCFVDGTDMARKDETFSATEQRLFASGVVAPWVLCGLFWLGYRFF